MTYAVLELSGRQFWVEPGKHYDINRIPNTVGKEIILNRVLLVKDENELRIGKPYLDSVKVTAKVEQHLLGKKTLIYKMRPKKKTRKKQGHRQKLTRILIENINLI
jgi:large subunit ribosomal protein L21